MAMLEPDAELITVLREDVAMSQRLATGTADAQWVLGPVIASGVLQRGLAIPQDDPHGHLRKHCNKLYERGRGVAVSFYAEGTTDGGWPQHYAKLPAGRRFLIKRHWPYPIGTHRFAARGQTWQLGSDPPAGRRLPIAHYDDLALATTEREFVVLCVAPRVVSESLAGGENPYNPSFHTD